MFYVCFISVLFREIKGNKGNRKKQKHVRNTFSRWSTKKSKKNIHDMFFVFRDSLYFPLLTEIKQKFKLATGAKVTLKLSLV